MSHVFSVGQVQEEKHPEPSIEFKYNLEKGQYERLNNLLEKRSKLDEFF